MNYDDTELKQDLKEVVRELKQVQIVQAEILTEFKGLNPRVYKLEEKYEKLSTYINKAMGGAVVLGFLLTYGAQIITAYIGTLLNGN